VSFLCLFTRPRLDSVNPYDTLGLVRFIPLSQSSEILIGEPIDGEIDVGAALRANHEVQVHVFSGKSVLDAGEKTEKIEVIGKVLSPLAQEEVGTIRCIGLNVR
jgi:hypothetical protein